jgi:hypothetical protein
MQERVVMPAMGTVCLKGLQSTAFSSLSPEIPDASAL